MNPIHIIKKQVDKYVLNLAAQSRKQNRLNTKSILC